MTESGLPLVLIATRSNPAGILTELQPICPESLIWNLTEKLFQRRSISRLQISDPSEAVSYRLVILILFAVNSNPHHITVIHIL